MTIIVTILYNKINNNIVYIVQRTGTTLYSFFEQEQF